MLNEKDRWQMAAEAVAEGKQAVEPRVVTTKEDAVHFILENPFWPKDLKTQEIYQRRHDDDDGSGKGHLQVCFGPDGDAWVITHGTRDALRFRTYTGGGKSLRTRAALLILAEAIRLDNEERSQQ